MKAKVISLCRFKQRREAAQRKAARPRAEGRTLVIDGLRYALTARASRELAAQIFDVLTSHTTVARGGIVIGPVQGRRGLRRFTLDCRCFDLPLVEASRGQLTAIASEMLAYEEAAR